MLPNEIIELMDDFLDGDDGAIAPEQIKALLRADAGNIDLFVQSAFLHQQLRESLAAEVATQDAPSSQQLGTAAPKPIVFPNSIFGAGGSGISSLLFGLLAFCAVAALVGAAFYLGRSTAAVRQVAINSTHPIVHTADTAPYVARLVKVTNCLWASNQNSSQPTQNSQLDPGETLNLLEGVAEIKSQSPAGAVGKLILEGPASLVLTSQGVPSLQHGKLSISIDDASDFRALNTPLGSLIASHNASFGVVSYSNKIEVHVFSGDVKFDLQLFSVRGSQEPLEITSGESLVLSLSPDGMLEVEQGIAREDSFITRASLSASHLNITESYVAAVKSSKPIAYWRFERLKDGYVPNEMGDDFACRIGGPIRWKTNPSGNRSAEFGLTTEPGLLVTDDEIKSLDHGFTIEFWLKPAYFQSASIFSLDKFVGKKPDSALQGVMVELTGPFVKGFPLPAYRYRFLHRSPPGSDINTGVSCFSKQPYEPRRWQHVAVVKENDEMRLFVDGKLCATGEDSTATAENLHVLMGQLYPFTKGPDAGMRPFAGELDEVAIYDRALDDAELNRHINLVRRELPDPKTW